MQTGLKVVIAFNVVATVLIWFLAHVFGGGFSGDMIQPPDAGEPMTLVRIEPKAAPPDEAVAPVSAPLPASYRDNDTPAPWTVQPDGTVRFGDVAR